MYLHRCLTTFCCVCFAAHFAVAAFLLQLAVSLIQQYNRAERNINSAIVTQFELMVIFNFQMLMKSLRWWKYRQFGCQQLCSLLVCWYLSENLLKWVVSRLCCNQVKFYISFFQFKERANANRWFISYNILAFLLCLIAVIFNKNYHHLLGLMLIVYGLTIFLFSCLQRTMNQISASNSFYSENTRLIGCRDSE